MTRDRFIECLEWLHWDTDMLAVILECDQALTEAYALGFEDVPPKLAAWLTVLAAAHEAAEEGKPRGLRGKGYRGESNC